jgi:4-diphosphocytidyl-2-C-methyl-D-erythritol kinase
VIFETAPAKLNLSLAVTGLREDGFHELLSLVVSIKLADCLEFKKAMQWSLLCDDASLATDRSNLVLKAAEVYQAHRPDTVVGEFNLKKLIPSGAGLGGGSSDAAAALRLLDRANPTPLGEETLLQLAAKVGSDCPYFITSTTAIMSGRGEILESVSPQVTTSLKGRRVMIVKPPFGVATQDAYALLAKSKAYVSPSATKQKLQDWLSQPASDPSLLGNTLEPVVFNKYLALPVALAEVSRATGINFRMTGSGSACFAFCPAKFDAQAVRQILERCWGKGCWVCETEIL